MPDYSYGWKDQAAYFAKLKAYKTDEGGRVTRSGLATAVAGQHAFDPGGSMRADAKIPGISSVLKRNYEVSQ
jgi:hypothetical protein